jgi:hypothetical protein
MPLDNRTYFLVNLRDHLSCRLCGKRPAHAEGYHQGLSTITFCLKAKVGRIRRKTSCCCAKPATRTPIPSSAPL